MIETDGRTAGRADADQRVTTALRDLRAVPDQEEPTHCIVSGPEQISPDDLAYLRVVAAQKQAADAIWGNWAGYLSQKYHLDPTDVGIDPEGYITRTVQAVYADGPATITRLVPPDEQAVLIERNNRIDPPDTDPS